MLVTFTCKAYADVTMFGDVAQRLLKIIGRDGTRPGVIMADDVPEMLDRLKKGVARETSKPNTDLPGNKYDDDEKQSVSLSHRALPLIELLSAAEKENCDVMWKTS